LAHCPLGSQEVVLAETLRHDHRGNRLLAALPPETLAILDGDLKRVSIAQGAVMFEAGAPLDTIYFPQTGLVSLLILTATGDALETTMVGREGAVGLQGRFGTRFSFTRAVAQIGGRFSVIGASRFGELVNGEPAVSNLFSRYTEVLLAEAQQIAACNAVHNGVSRLARCLLQSADRIGRDELALTQETLAEMLGARRTTVTLLAQALKEKGLIRYSRGHIVITNRKSLESTACECYHAVHHDRLPVTLGIKL
jgi:CRP-like cAMP-binding protein